MTCMCTETLLSKLDKAETQGNFLMLNVLKSMTMEDL